MLWKIGIPFIGILCLAYYAAVCIRLGKWNSTFSRFWLLAGTACLALRAACQYMPVIAQSWLWKLLWGPAAVFLVTEGLIVAGMKDSCSRELPYIIVLGAQVSGRTVTDSLRRRLWRAASYLKENPKTKVIVSGGKGAGEELTEAEVMKEFLIKEGIGTERIICEGRSATTRQNLEYSAEYVGSKEKAVGIVSNNFHMYRAYSYAKALGYKDVKRMPAGCYPLLLPNYMVREFFAVLKLWILKLFE